MKQIKKILCVVEPLQSSEAALIQTLRLAEDQQADVTFASVITRGPAGKSVEFSHFAPITLKY